MMSVVRPLVSCVIPSYRRSDTLRRAINSVLAQTYKNIELLIVDDNIIGDEYSIKLHNICKEYELDSRVILLTQPKHINGAEARNVGIRVAHGTWVAFLDDDDEWLPDKIERQIEVLSKSPNCMGVSCLYNEYRKGSLVHSCPPYNPEEINFKIFSRQVAVFTSTVMLNRERLLEFGAFNNKLKRHQDLQLLLDFTARNEIAVVHEYLVNLHLDSDINRPSLRQFIGIKKDFFEIMKSLFDTYSMSERKVIMSAHYYEIAFSAMKEKNIILTMKYIVKASCGIKGLKLLIQRFKDRKYKIESPY